MAISAGSASLVALPIPPAVLCREKDIFCKSSCFRRVECNQDSLFRRDVFAAERFAVVLHGRFLELPLADRRLVVGVKDDDAIRLAAALPMKLPIRYGLPVMVETSAPRH